MDLASRPCGAAKKKACNDPNAFQHDTSEWNP